MAAADTLESLKEEATCSICLEFYNDPVSTECGHNFCRSCITECWKGRGAPPRCPQCRATSGHFRANRQLRSIVELVRKLPQQPEGPLGDNLCQEHEERRRIFCEDDGELICGTCSISADHKAHSLIPIKEAARKYTGTLQYWLPVIRKIMEETTALQLKEQERSKSMVNILETEKEKTVAKFERLHRLLKEEEHTLLRRLEEMERKIYMAETAKLSELSQKMSYLGELITEVEAKCELPAEDLLKDIRSTLRKFEKVTFQKSDRDRTICRRNLNTAKHLTIPKLEERVDNYKVMVNLDAETAHHWLIVSEDGRRVRNSGTTQILRDNPKRFSDFICVLGSEGFSSGKHYWELHLLKEGLGWSVGVARESVRRKESVREAPDSGIWAIGRWWNGRYKALTSPTSPLVLRKQPRKLRLYLDYENDWVSMYNLDTMEHLYTFPHASFSERVFPYFCIGYETDLCLV